jgi:small GTP-binding protein
VKILMLGDSGVGKTSLMSRWTEDTFNDNMIGTLGVDFKMKQIMIEGASVQVQVWDTAGQERFRKITRAYYKNAHGIILVYDTVSRETFENISYWMESIQEHSGDGVQVAVVGNKIDLRDSAPPDSKEVVSTEEATSILDSHGDTDAISFFEASAKNRTGVDNAFLDVISKIVRQQLDYESLMTEGNDEAAKGKKNKKFKTPKRIKKLLKGGKKVAKGEKCVIS